MHTSSNAQSLSARLDTLFALCLALGVVLWVNGPHTWPPVAPALISLRVMLLNAAFTLGFVAAWSVCFSLLGLYHRGEVAWYRLLLRAAAGSIIMTAVLSLYLGDGRGERHNGKILMLFFAVSFVFQVFRSLLTSGEMKKYMRGPERVIILGSGPRASKAWRELRTEHSRWKQVIGFVDDRDAAEMPPDIRARFIGNVDSLPEYLLRNAIDELIVATPRSSFDITQRAITIAESAGLRLVVLNDVYELKHQKKLRQTATMFLELVPKDSSRETAELAKRVVDLVGSAVGLLLLAPLFLVIGIAVKAADAGPVFFVQERYGYAAPNLVDCSTYCE